MGKPKRFLKACVKKDLKKREWEREDEEQGDVLIFCSGGQQSPYVAQFSIKATQEPFETGGL